MSLTIDTTNTLRGPADPKRFRTTVYNARHYIDNLPGCPLRPEPTKPDEENYKLPSITTIKNAWHKEFYKNIESGQRKITVPLDAYRVADYVTRNVAKVNAMQDDPEGLMTLLATAAGRSLSAASNRGSEVHHWLELIANGADLLQIQAMNPDAAPYLETARAFVRECKPAYLATEYVGFNHALGYAGTGDSMARLLGVGDGEAVYCIDFKTRGPDSPHGAYVEDACQIAACASFEYVLIEDEEKGVVRAPTVQADIGLVVSIKPDGYELYPIDLQDGFEAFTHLRECWTHKRDGQKAARRAIGHPLHVARDITPTHETNVAKAFNLPVDPFGGLPADYVEPTYPQAVPVVGEPNEGTPEDLEKLRKRWEWIEGQMVQLNEHGRSELARWWPLEVLPPLKQRDMGIGYNDLEMNAIVAALKEAQKASRAPFPDPDPSNPKFIDVGPEDEVLTSLLQDLDELPKDLSGGVLALARQSQIPAPKAGTSAKLAHVLQLREWVDTASEAWWDRTNKRDRALAVIREAGGKDEHVAAEIKLISGLRAAAGNEPLDAIGQLEWLDRIADAINLGVLACDSDGKLVIENPKKLIDERGSEGGLRLEGNRLQKILGLPKTTPNSSAQQLKHLPTVVALATMESPEWVREFKK